MAQFVSDHRTDCTVVDRIVSIQVEKWRLQDCGGKNDFVHRRAVVCVDRLRRHVPFVAINRPAKFLQIAVVFEFGRSD